jgi:hypothetical protein
MSIDFSTKNSPENLNLNVANGNGYMILRDLLDIPSPESWGSIDPSAVLRALAVSRARVAGLVRGPSESRAERVVLTAEGVSVEQGCLVIDCGVSGDQLARYTNTLTALAQWAEAAGETILWG